MKESKKEKRESLPSSDFSICFLQACGQTENRHTDRQTDIYICIRPHFIIHSLNLRSEINPNTVTEDVMSFKRFLQAIKSTIKRHFWSDRGKYNSRFPSRFSRRSSGMCSNISGSSS